MNHFYMVRSNLLTLNVEPDMVATSQPPGNYIIFGNKETKANQFQIISLDQPDLTKEQWESYFYNSNIKVINIEQLPCTDVSNHHWRKVI